MLDRLASPLGRSLCKLQEKLSAELDELKKEEAAILARQKELKAALYGRFGKAINLEE